MPELVRAQNVARTSRTWFTVNVHSNAGVHTLVYGPQDSMEIEAPNGESIAMVKKALITPIRERWVVKVQNGPDLEVHGNILDHEYTIGEGRDKVAEISKKWFRIADSYGVAIEAGQNDVVILAVAV